MAKKKPNKVTVPKAPQLPLEGPLGNDGAIEAIGHWVDAPPGLTFDQPGVARGTWLTNINATKGFAQGVRATQPDARNRLGNTSETADALTILVTRRLTARKRVWQHDIANKVYQQSWKDGTPFEFAAIANKVSELLGSVGIYGITIEGPEELKTQGLALRITIPEAQFKPMALQSLGTGDLLRVHEARSPQGRG